MSIDTILMPHSTGTNFTFMLSKITPRDEIYRKLLQGRLLTLDPSSNVEGQHIPLILFDELFHGQTPQYVPTIHSTKVYQVFFVLDRSCGTIFDIFYDRCIAYGSQTASVSSSSA